jgi:hypothetical protein
LSLSRAWGWGRRVLVLSTGGAHAVASMKHAREAVTTFEHWM